MERYNDNGYSPELELFETPFADNTAYRETENERSPVTENQYIPQMESPFLQTFEAPADGQETSPMAAEFVQLLGELEDTEFPNTLYQLAAELEESWNSKISNEAAMGDRFVPFATLQANEYFEGLLNETNRVIDQVSEYYSGNNLAEHSEAEIERYFAEFEFGRSFSPAQDQFLGSVFKKIKSVVKTGVNLVKKGIKFVGKILPIGLILNKLKALIKPLLGKVLKFAIGKLPLNLRPYAQTFANKFLNIRPAAAREHEDNEIPSTGNLEAIQTEFDSHIANLVFSENEEQFEDAVMSYEASSDSLQRENEYESGGLNIPSFENARQQFINELQNLKEGESPAPAIERFLPALYPIIKMGLTIIGRQKVINFLAGLLAKLVGKFVPANIAKPLSASIIDVGMSAIGFETYEMDKPDLAHEAIANTIQETMQNLGQLNEDTLNNNEALTAELLEAFENAAANNFPAQYIREEIRRTSQPGVWINAPRRASRHYYKKFSQVFNITLTPQIANKLTSFRGVPIAGFLRDKLGLDPSRPIQARVHLYEAIQGTKLSQISRFEKVQGLGPAQRNGSVQLHPLSVEAAALLCREPGLGKDFPAQYTTRRYKTALGQRFYYLEINGARLRVALVQNRPGRLSGGAVSPANPQAIQADSGNTGNSGTPQVANSTDIQGVINFVRSEIKFNYYFSEEEAKNVIEKMNRNDFIGAATSIKHSVKNVLNGILLRNVGSKVRIIHEAMPEMYLENYVEQESVLSGIGRAARGIALNSGRQLLTSIVERLIEKLSELAHQSIADYFRTRAAEFKQAQAQPDDGVTIKITWANVPGMSAIRTVINAIKGNLSVGNISEMSLPNIPAPVIEVKAGKKFD